MNAIETCALTKSYGKSRGIVQLSLAVEQGDFFGFVGPNGAGKSTTIRSLLGLITPTSGSARVLGLDPTTQRRELLARVGYLAAEANFYDGMTVAETLRLSADLRGKDCSAEAKALCRRLDLDPSRKIRQLSLGNRKKVGIVCALQHRPDLYILDEPTGGLDPLMQREFFALLRERSREGATVFLSSHILSEVQRYCTHAAVIRDGRLLACDRVEALGHTGTKRVTLRGVETLPPLPAVRDVSAGPEGISFLYAGEPRALLQALAQLPVQDISIAEPDLEEVFLHYYEKEEQ